MAAPALIVPISACMLGFASGLRHAIEPDHLTAVAALIAGRRTPVASARYAAVWGLGHGTTLAIAAGALSILGASLPERAGDALELAVSATLIALGVRALASMTKPGRPPAASVPSRAVPFAVGLVHGLAGSGALAALVASRMPSPPLMGAFVLLYALGAATGMSVLAGLLGVPLGTIARSPRGLSALVIASGGLSLVVGVLWATPIVARLV